MQTLTKINYREDARYPALADAWAEAKARRHVSGPLADTLDAYAACYDDPIRIMMADLNVPNNVLDPNSIPLPF